MDDEPGELGHGDKAAQRSEGAPHEPATEHSDGPERPAFTVPTAAEEDDEQEDDDA